MSKHVQPITEEPNPPKADLGAHHKIETTEAELVGEDWVQVYS